MSDQTVIERYALTDGGGVFDTQTRKVMSPRAVLAGLNLCEHLSRQPEQLAGMVPRDDAAVERGARKLYAEVFVVADMSTYPPGALSWDNAPDYARDEATRCAEAVLRAAGAQQDAAAKPKASGPDA